MKRITIIFFLLFSVSIGFSQNLYKATSGEISFFSETPMENIDAVNKKVKALINSKNGDVAFIVTNVGFKFEKPLMEEHFNENYIESDKYKTSMFKGKIEGSVDFTKNGTYPVIVKGVLSIHGVDREREIEGEIIIVDSKIRIVSEFNINIKDHEIQVPKLVIKNIAETIKATVNIDFETKD